MRTGANLLEAVEIAYGVTSLGSDETTAEGVLATNRNHWAVDSAHKYSGRHPRFR